LKEELIELDFIKNNKYNQKIRGIIKNKNSKQYLFLEILFLDYPYLKDYSLSDLINILNSDLYNNINDLKCIINDCKCSKLYISTKKRLRHSCKEHLKHPIVIQHSKEIRKEKTQKTNLEKYGVANVSNINSIKDKKQETYKKNFGTDDKIQELTKRRQETYFDKTGYTNPRKNPEIIKRVKLNNMEKHGYSHYMKNPLLKENYQMNNYQNKGYIFPRQINRKNVEDLTKEFVENNFICKKTNTFLKNEFNTYYGFLDDTEPYKYLKKFNIDYKHLKGVSRAEQEIINYILSLDPSIKIIKNSRDIIKPFELDIYLPDYNLAIEYNGAYWHSSGIEDSLKKRNQDVIRHQQKTELCEELNINLLHIFDYEFLDPIKKNIWFSIIKNKLNKNNGKVPARKCIIKEVSVKESSKFFLENHIQGNSSSSIKLGLYYNNELFSIMTFGKPKFNKDYEYELIRFVTKKGINVIGGASKLLKYFQKTYNPFSIISYGNRNILYSKKNLYLSLGFKEIIKNKPSIKYWKNGKIFNRSSMTKTKCKKIFNYDESKSTDWNILNNKFRIIHPVGTITYSLS